MINRLVKKTFDLTFGLRPVRHMFLSLFGHRWNGWVLGFIGYRAIYMVEPGETCILGGIFNKRTVENFARAVGENGAVVVAEANPENVARLERELAPLKNVQIVHRAVWRGSGEIEFLLTAQDKPQGYNRIKSDELQDFPYHMDDQPMAVKVQTSSLDEIAALCGLGVVHHVNLTINGAELQAMEGMAALRKANPKLRVYINSEKPKPAVETVEALRALGFIVYTSDWIRTVNKRISLRRIYAVGRG